MLWLHQKVRSQANGWGRNHSPWVPLPKQLQQLKEGHCDPIIFGYKSYIVFTQVKHKTSLNCRKCLRVVGKRHFFHSVLKRTDPSGPVSGHWSRGKGAPCGYSRLMGQTIPTQVINSHLTAPSITTRGSSTILGPRLKTNFILKPWDTSKSPMLWCRQENPGRQCTGTTQREAMGREVEGGFGKRVPPWLIHVNVWQKTPQYCKVISLQLK